jgi:ParB family chromosome partitioning protein
MSLSEPQPDAPPAPAPAPLMRELPAADRGAGEGEIAEPKARVLDLPLSLIVPNPHQPRREFNDASLAELAASLKSTGMIQPVIVRPDGQAGGRYQLIAGERRWRAAKLAELPTLPAIVRDVDGPTQAQMALIENIQREDLNPLDRARAYQTLLNHLGLTQAELAGRLGEDRSTVTHFLRILDLAEPVQRFIGDGRLTLAHAKLLSGVPDPAEQQRLAELAVAQSLSVRNLERLIPTGTAASPVKTAPATVSAHVKELERSLSMQLSLRAQIRSSRKKGHGQLVLHYTSLDQFDELMARLGVKTDLE